MTPGETPITRGVSRRCVLRAAGASTLPLAGCTTRRDGNPDGDGSGSTAGVIDISGSSTVYPVTVAMAELFNHDHPDVDISVSRDGTSGGFENAFIPGRSDINNASRPITPDEVERCRATGFEPIEFLIARDALTIVVHTANEWVDCIDLDTLGAIWSPEDPPRTWADVDPDWPAEPFDLYGPASTSGTFDYFTEHVVGEAGAIRSDFEGTEEDDNIAHGVQGNRYAMGYLPFAYYTNNPEQTKALALDAGDGCVEPSLETAKSGAYSLARPLFIYVNSRSLEEKPSVRAFVRFYIENATRDDLVAEQIGYVPIAEAEADDHLRTLDDYAPDGENR